MFSACSFTACGHHGYVAVKTPFPTLCTMQEQGNTYITHAFDLHHIKGLKILAVVPHSKFHQD